MIQPCRRSGEWCSSGLEGAREASPPALRHACAAPEQGARATARRLASLSVVLLILAGCGGSSGSAAKTTSTTSTAAATPTTPAASAGATPSMSAPATLSASSGGVTATMHAGSHHPTVNVPWPVRFTVTRGGSPVRASVSYQYLFNGQIVARRSHYVFTGHFADTFEWPASAVGYPLTLRAVIVSGATTLDLDYAVQVIT